MPIIEPFFAGFLVGALGTLALVLRKGSKAISPSTEEVTQVAPHTDNASAANIGHDRGIEVFDD